MVDGFLYILPLVLQEIFWPYLTLPIFKTSKTSSVRLADIENQMVFTKKC